LAQRLTREELLSKLALGEDGTFELKDVRFAGDKVKGPSQDVLADEIAAFANARGGVVLLGVDDTTREVRGIPLDRLDAVESLVREACESSVKPPVAPLIERVMLPAADGTEVAALRIDVDRSLTVHQSPSGYLHRVGSSKRPIPSDQLGRLFQQRSQSRLIRFDETPVSRAEMSDLDETLWRRFAPTSSAEHSEVLLSKLAMAAKDDDGAWRPTVAGLLMGCAHPERRLPGAFIQAVAYRGTEVVPAGDRLFQLDMADFVGPLDRQIVDACGFVRRNMKIAARKRLTGGREDIPQFDLLSVFEAVTNAVAHRDYSLLGSKVRLRLFADRLEIYTPGALTNTMTPESLAFRQAARNEAVTSLLARCPLPDEAALSDAANVRTKFMDKRGEGVPIIIQRSLALSGRAPVFRMVDESELLLTIFAAGEGCP
jgi:ATP-dependent DNA helicase RecG